ncbi:MAG TPA: hypothetical protein VGC91_07755 [Pyrinomonadaceae bacterium]|jgi:hypothetical protein
MTNEEMQRAMDFIIQQQAQFASDIQELRESQKELFQAQQRGEERTTQIEVAILRLVGVVERVVETQARTDQKLAETDERLNSLINVVERYISERRNGKSEG